jgi:hypothetical protein
MTFRSGIPREAIADDAAGETTTDDGLIPVELNTIDAEGRPVWSYRMTPDDNETPLPRTFRKEMNFHIDYSPHAYPWRNEIVTRDGRTIPAKEWQEMYRAARQTAAPPRRPEGDR